MIMGFIIHFYITFGTNLLTEAQPILLFYCLFQYFEEKEYQTESKRNETFGNVIFGTNVIQRTWSASQEAAEAATRQEGAPTPSLHAPYLVRPSGGHRCTSYSYISLRTPKTSREPTKHNLTTVTICIREIPSWSLRRCFARGGIDHGGLLHQHHSPSDEL